MSESIHIAHLLHEAEEAIQTCNFCHKRGHGLEQCPVWIHWLRSKTAPPPVPQARVTWSIVLICGIVCGLLIRWWLA